MPDTTLKVTLVQAELAWHDAAVNRRKLDALLAGLAGATDLIVLPEMFTTGFTMAPESVVEPAGGPTTAWLRATAERLGAVVTGSVATVEGGHYFNRLIWMRPDGSFATYDKRHLFRMAGEDRHYQAGREALQVELKGWQIRPLICYDLRFPVFSRNRLGTPAGYDLLLYVANWPAARRHAWRTLLQARAIENLCYCVGVNRVGVDGNGIHYSGDSAAVDFLGMPLRADSEGEFVATCALDPRALAVFRGKFPAYLDADAYDLRL